LLDEIAEMPTALQAKLLHVLQDNQMFRLGGDTTISVDVRILAATSPKVEQALLEKKLREDVYYRLSAFTLHVPPLRDRREEIPLLLAHFIKQLAKRYGLKPRPVSAVLLNGCHTYSWPGNLRELENVAKRYLVMGDDFLELGELGVRPISHADDNSSSSVDSEGATPVSGHGEHRDAAHLKNLVRSIKGETERNVIASTLEKTQWNRKAAARDLGISYRGLLYKIQEYHLIPPGHYVPSVPKTMHGSVTDRNTDLRRS
jgi:DNA-binding NtrC family response regulator